MIEEGGGGGGELQVGGDCEGLGDEVTGGKTFVAN